MHLLEDHASSFLKEWGAGFGLYGEQGMEGSHAAMNSLKRSYEGMPNRKERLTAIMKEHYISTNPNNGKMNLGNIKKRKHED